MIARPSPPRVAMTAKELEIIRSRHAGNGDMIRLLAEVDRQAKEIERLRRLLSAWRYAKAFAGAEAWDGGHDMRERFGLVDSVSELAGIDAATTLDDFRAALLPGE